MSVFTGDAWPTHLPKLGDVEGIYSDILLHDMGDHAAARSLFERAMAIWENALGPEHPDLASSINERIDGLYHLNPAFQSAHSDALSP